MARHTGLAGRIRAALRELSAKSGHGVISYHDIARHCGITDQDEKNKLFRGIQLFLRRGECTEIDVMQVRYNPRLDPRPAKKTRCMYRLIRANRTGTVTVADLVANCGVTRHTAQIYLQALTRRGIVRRIAGPGNSKSRYQMISDPGPNLVRDDDAAAKRRRQRAAQKAAAMQKLDAAGQALISATQTLVQARMTLADMDMEDNANGDE